MQYVYGAMWLIVAFILIFSIAKENRIFYFAGGFFAVLGAWWIADGILEADLMSGVPGLVLRIFTGVCAVILGAAFVREFLKNRKKAEPPEE